jgi:hypothetical protein
METDSSECVAAVTASGSNRSSWSGVVQDCKDLMARSREVNIVKGMRGQNAIAHELAQYARRVNSSAIWRAENPSCIVHLLSTDCNHVTP